MNFWVEQRQSLLLHWCQVSLFGRETAFGNINPLLGGLYLGMKQQLTKEVPVLTRWKFVGWKNSNSIGNSSLLLGYIIWRHISTCFLQQHFATAKPYHLAWPRSSSPSAITFCISSHLPGCVTSKYIAKCNNILEQLSLTRLHNFDAHLQVQQQQSVSSSLSTS